MKTSKWLALTLAVTILAGGSFILHAAPRKAVATEKPGRGASLQRAREKLDLTDEQVTRIKAVLKADKENLTSLISRMREARGSLRETIRKPDANETSVRAAAAKVAEVEADLAVERLKLYGKISPILTAEQHEKLHQLAAQAGDFLDGIMNRLGNKLAE